MRRKIDGRFFGKPHSDTFLDPILLRDTFGSSRRIINYKYYEHDVHFIDFEIHAVYLF